MPLSAKVIEQIFNLIINKLMGFASMVYRSVIDPMLSSSHRSALSLIDKGDSVLDVACGDGTLAFMISGKAKMVTAIDIDREMLNTAKERQIKQSASNIIFIEMDATDFSRFKDKEFDTSVISMALHQFLPSTGLAIIEQMKRVSKKIVIVDYAFPVKKGLYRSLTWLIEWIAGGDHYRNFRRYIKRGGAGALLKESSLRVKDTYIRGKGTIMISSCILPVGGELL